MATNETNGFNSMVRVLLTSAIVGGATALISLWATSQNSVRRDAYERDLGVVRSEIAVSQKVMEQVEARLQSIERKLDRLVAAQTGSSF